MIEPAVHVVLLLGLGAVALLAAGGGVLLFVRRRWPFIAAFAAFAVVEQHFGVDAGLRLPGYTVSPMDLLSVAGLAAAALRTMDRRGLRAADAPWVLLALVLLLAFVRGAQAFGFQPAASFYRRFFYLSAAIVYMLSFAWDGPALDRFVRGWVGVAVLLAGVVLLGWIEPRLVPGLAAREFSDVLAFDRERVLPASSALLLAQAGLIGLAARWRHGLPGRPQLLAFGLLAVMALLFHRSVWLAAWSGAVTLLALRPGLAARLVPPLATGGLLLAALWMLRLGWGGAALPQALQSAVSEPFGEASSLGWRIDGWSILLLQALADGLVTIVFGAGFGAGYERRIGAALIDVSPHNFYLETFLNAGLLGLGLWLLALLRVALRLYRGTAAAPAGAATPTGLRLEPAAALALLVTLAVYGIPYTQTAEQGLLVGALAAAARRAAGGTA